MWTQQNDFIRNNKEKEYVTYPVAPFTSSQFAL